MTIDEATAIFSAYSLQEKEDFLAHLIYELTILARETYEVGGEGLTNPQRARRINEVQHRLGAFLLALLRNNSQRYPDDTLVRIILKHPGDDILERQLNETFARLASQHLTVA